MGDYENLYEKKKFHRTLKISLLIICCICFVLLPSLWLWDQSIQQRLALREAKNVLLNTELLSIEYYGFNKPIVDTNRPSGMSQEAEEEIRSFSGADGIIHLISWDEGGNQVMAMSYQKGRFLVQYQYEKSDDTYTWDIYWKVHRYDNQR